MRHGLSWVVTIGFAAATVYGIVLWVIDSPPGELLPGDAAGALLLAWFIAVSGVAAWRIALLRTDVTDEVVRIQGFWTTKEVDRGEVVGFEVAPVGRFGLDTIAVVTTDGRRLALRGLEGPVQVPVWVTGHGYLTLPRAAQALSDVVTRT